mmetsp:Transcript_101494/g.316471  ORF Transcript_101494/g.316471 Transcript_101494/m.316471 type:complete len:202 (+) Transcript_101494:671-1276(+)
MPLVQHALALAGVEAKPCRPAVAVEDRPRAHLLHSLLHGGVDLVERALRRRVVAPGQLLAFEELVALLVWPACAEPGDEEAVPHHAPQVAAVGSGDVVPREGHVAEAIYRAAKLEDLADGVLRTRAAQGAGDELPEVQQPLPASGPLRERGGRRWRGRRGGRRLRRVADAAVSGASSVESGKAAGAGLRTANGHFGRSRKW